MLGFLEKYEFLATWIELLFFVLVFIFFEWRKYRKEKNENEENEFNKKFSDICVYFYVLIIRYYRTGIQNFKKKNLFNDNEIHTLETYMIKQLKQQNQGYNFNEKEWYEKCYNENLNQLQNFVLKKYESDFKINLEENEIEIIKKICLFCIEKDNALFYTYNDDKNNVMENLRTLNIHGNKIKSFLKENNFSKKEINKIYDKISMSKNSFNILLTNDLYDDQTN